MEALEIPRFFFGLALVLFIPGFALTFALWPKTKKDVYREIADVLKKNGAASACAVGREENVEELSFFLKENSIPVCSEKDAEALILAENLEGDIKIPAGKMAIDLANNSIEAVKIEGTIDSVERTALSVGLSIAIVPLIGLILDKTPYGIRLPSVLASLVFVVVLFCGIYFYRRKKWTTSKSLS
ncbi:MAG: DUF1616 domain-containing protein [Euryarchaeota archaeon]|nr:DUF1616 domain-containing protein [Euryarchaeota archaeon]